MPAEQKVNVDMQSAWSVTASHSRQPPVFKVCLSAVTVYILPLKRIFLYIYCFSIRRKQNVVVLFPSTRVWRNWQTRTVQVRMNASSWGFKSLRPHHLHLKSPFTGLFCYLFVVCIKVRPAFFVFSKEVPVVFSLLVVEIHLFGFAL